MPRDGRFKPKPGDERFQPSIQTLRLYPNAPGYYTELSQFPVTGAHWDKVDELYGAPDDNSTYIHVDNVFIDSCYPFLRLGGVDLLGSAQAFLGSYTNYVQEIGRPGGGDWSESDLADLQVGIRMIDGFGEPAHDSFNIESCPESGGVIGKVEVFFRIVVVGINLRCTQVHVLVTYLGPPIDVPEHLSVEYGRLIIAPARLSIETGISESFRVQVPVEHGGVQPHPPPIDVQIDRQTNPINASDDPLFSAIFQALGESGSASYIQIQVAEDSDFSTINWDSGWTAITSCPHGTRSDEISYNGSGLSSSPPDSQYRYFVRIKFKDAIGVESEWSDTNTFSGVRRSWTATGYPLRHKLLWDPLTTAAGVPAGYVQKFEFKTGNRKVIATNGHFNEAHQPGGFQVAYYNGRTHVCYLGRLENFGNDNYLTWYIQSYDHQTEQWGTPFFVCATITDFDTHYFPSNVIDGQGYLHLAGGAHNSTFIYTRSALSNQSGALPGDLQTDTWINPQTGNPGWGTITGWMGTYPFGFYVASKGRVYWLSRAFDNHNWQLIWSNNNGVTWSTPRNFIQSTSGMRVYVLGIRWDEIRQRLHISYTHEFTGNVAKGIWYAYSDLDETDGNSPTNEGFNMWHWADGTVAGYTAGATGVPIDYNVGKAIRFADDYLASIFTENLVLDKDGEPLVFWEQKLVNTAIEYARETHIWVGKYSLSVGTPGGTWNTVAISEDLDLMMLVRRSSIGVMTNKQGIIKLYMAAAGKTYNQHTPTADIDSVGVTRKSEASNYLEVDDGFSGCDLDGSYCDLAATTGAMSFTSNRIVPNAVTFFEVSLVAFCRFTSGSNNFKFYISNGVTDNDGANKTTTSGYVWYEQVWTTNPFTSLPWTKSDIESLEFGIKNIGSYPLRVTSIFMRVMHSMQSDDELTTATIWELSSADGGYTWQKRELARNSDIGVPMFNQKPDYSNDTIEVVWTSGYDIFYLAEKPYGLVQKTGQDLRLYYNGTEVDRLVDYMNKDKTVVRFKVQEAIPVNARAGPKDYELYIANKNETGQPKSDANQIYLFQENFETYSEAQNMNGVNGWTAVEGTWQIWRAPPLRNPLGDGHSNKVGAGMQSVRCAAGGTLERILGSGLTDLYIEALIWFEDGNGQIYLEVEEAGGDKFGVGFRDTISPPCAGYRDNGTWVDVTSVAANSANYTKIAMLITATGTWAWVNDELVADGITPSVTSVGKLRLVCPSESFFDKIMVSKRPFTDNPVLEVQPLDARGYYVDCALLGAGQHQYIVDCKLDGDFVRIVNRLAIEHITAVDLLTRFPISYERLLLSIFDLPVEHDSSIIAPVDLPVEHGGSIISKADIAVDYDNSILIRIDLPIEYGLCLPFANILPIDNLGDKSIIVLLAVAASSNRAIPIYLSLDFVRGLVLSHRLSAEHLHTLAIPIILPVDGRLFLNPTTNLSIECTQDSQFGMTIPTDSLAGIQTARMIPVGAMSALINYSIVPTAFAGTLAIPNRLSVESLVARLLNGSLPVSFAHSLVSTHNLAVSIFGGISFMGMLPADNLTSLLKAEYLAVENLVRRDAVAVLPTELLQVLRSITIQPTGWLAGLLDIFVVPVESKMSSSQLTVLSTEVLVGLTASGLMSIDLDRTLNAPRILPVEWQGAFVLQFPGLLPIDILSGLVRYDKLPVDGSFNLRAHGITSSDWLYGLAAPLILPVSVSGTVSGRHLLSTETLHTSQQSSFDPVEHLVEMVYDGNLPAAWDKTLHSITRLPVSWDGTFLFAVPGALPVEFSGTVAIRGLQSTDNLKSLRQNGPVLSIEFNGTLTIPHSVPVGSLKQLAEAYEVPIAGEHSIVTLRQTFVEFLQHRQSRSSLPIGYEQVNEIVGMLSVEWFGGVRLATIAVCPVEWQLTLDMNGNVAVESVVDRVGSIIMPMGGLTELSIAGKLPNDFSATLSQMAANISVDWLAKRILAERMPVEFLTDLQQQFLITIERLTKRNLDFELPASWDGAILMNFPGVLPISWESTLLARPLMPADNTRTLSMISGNLMVEWNVSRELSAKFPVEYNKAIEIGTSLVSDWLETVNCQGRLSIESRGTIEDIVATFAIEYNRRLFAVSQVPLAELFGLAVSGKIPVGWIGLTFAFLCVRNIKLTVPTAIEIALQVPGVTDAEVCIPEAIDIILKGGEGCQTT